MKNRITRLGNYRVYWDPTEPSATRPLALNVIKNGAGTLYFPTVDLTKNVCELVDFYGNVATSYDYAPFGACTETLPAGTLSAPENPFRFSSEFYDSELDLIYYNFRHYSPALGRFLSRDPIAESGGLNLYAFVRNKMIGRYDKLGLVSPFILIDTIDVVEYTVAYISDLKATGGGDEVLTYLSPLYGEPSIIKVGFSEPECGAGGAIGKLTVAITGRKKVSMISDNTYLTERYSREHSRMEPTYEHHKIDVLVSLSVLSIEQKSDPQKVFGEKYMHHKFTIEYTFTFTHEDPRLGSITSPVYHKTFVYERDCACK